MKIKFNLKDKFPSIEFCYNNKVVIVRYWGGLKFDKVIIYKDMEKNSMTAVEWLVEQMTPYWLLEKTKANEFIEQALTMEKEQIVDAYYQIGKDHPDMIFPIKRDAEQYYNETYNK